MARDALDYVWNANSVTKDSTHNHVINPSYNNTQIDALRSGLNSSLIPRSRMICESESHVCRNKVAMITDILITQDLTVSNCVLRHSEAIKSLSGLNYSHKATTKHP